MHVRIYWNAITPSSRQKTNFVTFNAFKLVKVEMFHEIIISVPFVLCATLRGT